MKPYSKDLSLKMVGAVDRRVPTTELAEVFGVSLPTIKPWLKRRSETGEVAAKPNPCPPARKGAALDEAITSQVRANPDYFTLGEHRQLFEETYGISVSTSNINQAF